VNDRKNRAPASAASRLPGTRVRFGASGARVTAALLTLAWVGVPLGLHAEPPEPKDSKDSVELDLRLDRPIIRIDSDRQATAPRVTPLHRAYVRLRITARAATATTRHAPLNIAIAVDRTGHEDPEMDAAITEAVQQALESLAPHDVVALVAYSDTVEVLAAAGPPRQAAGIMLRLMAGKGNGALGPNARGANLFGGVAKAAAEVRRHTSHSRVSHVLVISAQPPGLGPQSPNALAQFGASVAREGVGVTVIQTGSPDEPAIRALTVGAGGTFLAVQDAGQVGPAVDETIARLRSVRARDIRVQMSFDGNTPPTRIVGSVGEIARTRVNASWRELRAARTLELIAQVDTDRCVPGSHPFAQAELRYFDVQTNREITVLAPLGVTCALGDTHESHFDFEVATSVSIALGEEAREAARRALGRGDRVEAERVLSVVLKELRDTASAMKHPEIMSVVDDLESELRTLDGLPPGAYRDAP